MIKSLFLMLFVLIYLLKTNEKFSIINNKLKPIGNYLNDNNLYTKKIDVKDRAEILLNKL